MQDALSYAQSLDQNDSLKHFREQFHIPTINGKEVIYLCGNSLGLQPRTTAEYIQKELAIWSKHGVEGHFVGENPWVSYHKQFAKPLSHLVGAEEEEVVCMNALTVNLHILFASFYQPKGKRTKILIEADCFPSDRYAVESQLKWHGLDPKEHLIEVSSENYLISTEKIEELIQTNREELALVWLGGVNYLSGQVLDMKAISEAAHAIGAKVGFDLAHAIGNIDLQLHEWDVDFATWCSYKYLNSGPGGVSGVYIHEKHTSNPKLLRLAGWWGTTEESRFEMKHTFEPIPSAESWQMSNAPVLSMAAHKSSLTIFEEAGFEQLRDKSKELTAYLAFLLQELEKEGKIQVITPDKRGCQLSVLVGNKGKEFTNELKEKGVILDWREPSDSHKGKGIMRVAPVPLYNSFEDVWRFVEILKVLL